MKQPPRLPLIGRAAELDALRTVVERHRLTTLWGPAGVGKTRLAAELVRLSSEPSFFVDLTDARTEADVLGAVGACVGARNSHVETIGEAMSEHGDAVWVLDNFEQVVSFAADTVGVWRQSCPRARLVITSREILRVADEVAFAVEPLAVQHATAFWHACRAADGGAKDDAGSVEQLVRRLDGLPLAIELAAARARMLSPKAILERMGERATLLSRGRRDAPPRQATLHGALEWSWNLLSMEEREVLAQCAVFRGGFSVESAEAIVRIPGQVGVLDVLHQLRDKSLVQPEVGASSRLRMLWSVRAHAVSKLFDLTAAPRVEERSSAHFAACARRWRAEVSRASGREALDRIAADRENLRAVVVRALTRSYDRQAVSNACWALDALDMASHLRGPRGDAVSLAEQLLPHVDHAGDADRAVLLDVVGRSWCRQGRTTAGLRILARALRSADASARLGLRVRARLSLVAAHATRSPRWLDEAHALSADDPRLRGMVLGATAALYDAQGDAVAAERLYKEAVAVFRESGDPYHEGITLTRLARLLLERGATQSLNEVAHQALAIHRNLGSRHLEGEVTLVLGAARHADAELAAAECHYVDALDAFRITGDRRGRRVATGYLAVLRLERGEHAGAIDDLGDVVEGLVGDGDPTHAAVFAAICAAACTARGESDRGRRLLERAEVVARSAPQLATLAVVQMAARGEPSPTSFHQRLLARLRTTLARVPKQEVMVDTKLRWIDVPAHARFDLRRKRALRRLVGKLVDERLARPGVPVADGELVRAGWPDERILPRAAKNRLHVALARLREAGLRDLLRMDDGAYFLDAAVPLRLVEDCK